MWQIVELNGKSLVLNDKNEALAFEKVQEPLLTTCELLERILDSYTF